jgi:hypothetical protein
MFLKGYRKKKTEDPWEEFKIPISPAVSLKAAQTLFEAQGYVWYIMAIIKEGK